MILYIPTNVMVSTMVSFRGARSGFRFSIHKYEFV